MGATPHTSFRKGKRVFVILKSGERFSDKYVERKGKGVLLLENGFIKGRDIRSMTIYRNQAH